jgi:Zn-dependent protease with chaperone function
MGVSPQNVERVSLPLSDLALLLFYSLIAPIIFLIPFLIVSSFSSTNFVFFLILSIPIGLIFFYLTYYHFVFRNRIKSLALRVSYYHFQPSWYDFGIHLIRYVYYILFFGFFLDFLIQIWGNNSVTHWDFFILAIIFSLGIQLFFVILSYRSKRNLVVTARESVDAIIITKLQSYEPKSNLIKEYRFADIQAQTLFLSAGVTSFGYSNNICLISRYFQWKLSEEEMLGVLLHEIGHISNHHLQRSYQLVGLEFILRTFRIFAIFSLINLLHEYSSLISLPPTSSLSFLLFCILTFVSSTLLFLITYYRSFLAEIESDYFSGSRIGFQLLADTLRKLPSYIPSPIGYNQSSFLGFRVALLRDIEKQVSSSS